jgi:nucleoside-diphosphate-sugar epimerase
MRGGLKGKRVLLAGGAGFIGSHLAAALATDNELFVVDNLYRQAARPDWLDRLPNLRFLHGDVRDKGLVRSFLPPDLTHVVDLAAVAGVLTVLEAPARAARANLDASLSLLDLASSLPRLEQLVYLSSSEVYGPEAADVAEDEVRLALRPEEPRWSYAVSKLAAESLLFQLWRDERLPVTIVRPFNVYGPGQLGESAVHAFALDALAGRPLRVRGSGMQRRAWCYVDDFLDGLLRVLARGGPLGRALNLGNPGAVCSVRELAEAVRAAAGSSSPIEAAPAVCQDVEVRIPDIGRAASLGFRPSVGLAEGLARTVAWYRSHVHAPAQAQPAG